MGKLGFFTKHSETIRKVLGVIIILAVIYIAFISKLLPTAEVKLTDSNTPVTQLEKKLAQPYPAPEFKGLEGWLNSEPLTMAGLKGKVVLVDFWTYSCINCVRTLPYIKAWDKKYRDKGLVIIGVHAPEFEFEKNADNVKKSLEQFGIKYPVALDSNLKTWENFHNEYWPAHYLIDQEMLFTHILAKGNMARRKIISASFSV
jgi:thiol-disulfide isomerase/thioredoxin